MKLNKNEKKLMSKCLDDFYKMHLDLSQDEDVEGFEGEQQFSIECYGVAHTMIKRLKKDSILDLDTNFKCNIANISIDHYQDDIPIFNSDSAKSYVENKILERLQNQIQVIWGVK